MTNEVVWVAKVKANGGGSMQVEGSTSGGQKDVDGGMVPVASVKDAGPSIEGEPVPGADSTVCVKDVG
ncbi:unnamed protein product [Linum trigynum]|uniref:Uncharacterized protein n=1 Tax=Linum trigynum TaxID=586398 RepID=A0AAV2F660_9ROSI